MDSFSKRLGLAMAKRGIDQPTLSRISGVPQSRISEIVSGKTKNPRTATISKLASALEVSLSWLISCSGEMDQKKQEGSLPPPGVDTPPTSTTIDPDLLTLAEEMCGLSRADRLMVIGLALSEVRNLKKKGAGEGKPAQKKSQSAAG